MSDANLCSQLMVHWERVGIKDVSTTLIRNSVVSIMNDYSSKAEMVDLSVLMTHLPSTQQKYYLHQRNKESRVDNIFVKLQTVLETAAEQEDRGILPHRFRKPEAPPSGKYI